VPPRTGGRRARTAGRRSQPGARQACCFGRSGNRGIFHSWMADMKLRGTVTVTTLLREVVTHHGPCNHSTSRVWDYLPKR